MRSAVAVSRFPLTVSVTSTVSETVVDCSDAAETLALADSCLSLLPQAVRVSASKPTMASVTGFFMFLVYITLKLIFETFLNYPLFRIALCLTHVLCFICQGGSPDDN